jgi:hypothetical protein
VTAEAWGVMFLDDEGAEGVGNEVFFLESNVSLGVEREVLKLGTEGSGRWECGILEVSNELF